MVIHSDHSYTYSPNPYANGTDNFTFKANDGTVDSNVGNDLDHHQFCKTIRRVAQDGTLVTSENRARDASFIVTDPDNDLLTYTIITPPAHGQRGLLKLVESSPTLRILTRMALTALPLKPMTGL